MPLNHQLYKPFSPVEDGLSLTDESERKPELEFWEEKVQLQAIASAPVVSSVTAVTTQTGDKADSVNVKKERVGMVGIVEGEGSSDSDGGSNHKLEPKPIPHRGSSSKFTFQEDLSLVRYMTDESNRYLQANGLAVWKCAVAENLCPGRTFWSLRERFIKQLAPRLYQFQVSKTTVKKVLQFMAATPQGKRQIRALMMTKESNDRFVYPTIRRKDDLRAPRAKDEPPDEPPDKAPDSPPTPSPVLRVKSKSKPKEPRNPELPARDDSPMLRTCLMQRRDASPPSLSSPKPRPLRVLLDDQPRRTLSSSPVAPVVTATTVSPRLRLVVRETPTFEGESEQVALPAKEPSPRPDLGSPSLLQRRMSGLEETTSEATRWWDGLSVLHRKKPLKRTAVKFKSLLNLSSRERRALSGLVHKLSRLKARGQQPSLEANTTPLSEEQSTSVDTRSPLVLSDSDTDIGEEDFDEGSEPMSTKARRALGSVRVDKQPPFRTVTTPAKNSEMEVTSNENSLEESAADGVRVLSRALAASSSRRKARRAVRAKTESFMFRAKAKSTSSETKLPSSPAVLHIH